MRTKIKLILIKRNQSTMLSFHLELQITLTGNLKTKLHKKI